MLGWALQNIFKQELPLYRKMEILLFRKLPELGFISDTSDNNTEKKNLSSCIQSASHILFTLSTSVRSWGKKIEEEMHVKNLKHRMLSESPELY